MTRKITAGQRLAAGFVIVTLAVLAFLAGEIGHGLFVIGAVLFPYLAFIAPLRCNNPTSQSRLPCLNNGWGLLIGCNWHRLDTVRRLLRRHPYQQPRTPASRPAPGATQAFQSGGIPAPAVGTVSFRRKVFDVVGLFMTTLGTVAGWLALFISPG